MVLIVSTVHLKPPLHRIGSINSSSIQFNTYENGYCDVFIIESCELYQKKHRGRVDQVKLLFWVRPYFLSWCTSLECSQTSDLVVNI